MYEGIISQFDTSVYPADTTMPSVNKKVLYKMKDANNGHIMEKFVGLKTKMGDAKTEKYVTKKAKGVKNYVYKQIITQ